MTRASRCLGRLALLVGSILVGVVGSIAVATPAGAATTAGYCQQNVPNSVTLVIDYGDIGPGVSVVCVTNLPTNTTGYDVLQAAGLAPAGTGHDGPGFVCRLGGYPAPGQVVPLPDNPSYTETCDLTPPYEAYWSYWHATDGGSWVYSNRGAMNYDVPFGTLEAWSFVHSSTEPMPPPRPPNAHTDLVPRATSTPSTSSTPRTTTPRTSTPRTSTPRTTSSRTTIPTTAPRTPSASARSSSTPGGRTPTPTDAARSTARDVPPEGTAGEPSRPASGHSDPGRTSLEGAPGDGSAESGGASTASSMTQIGQDSGDASGRATEVRDTVGTTTRPDEGAAGVSSAGTPDDATPRDGAQEAAPGAAGAGSAADLAQETSEEAPPSGAWKTLLTVFVIVALAGAAVLAHRRRKTS